MKMQNLSKSLSTGSTREESLLNCFIIATTQVLYHSKSYSIAKEAFSTHSRTLRTTVVMSFASFGLSCSGPAYVFSTVLEPFKATTRKTLCKASTFSFSHRQFNTSNSPARVLLPIASVATPRPHVRTYTRADETPVERLASSLASAFEHDPLFHYIQGSNGGDMSSRNKILLMSTLNLELSRPEGQSTMHVSEDDGSIAVWRHVNHWGSPFSMEILFMFTLFRTLGWGAIRFINTVRRVEESHPTEPHMYLFIMGTQTATQGRGIGSKLISKMLKECDCKGIPVYVESCNESNFSFYKRHGFKVISQIPGLPDDCPPIRALWTDPQTDQ